MTDLKTYVSEAFKLQESFCKVTLDAYVVLDIEKNILNLNSMFSQICGVKPKQILKTGDLSQIINFTHDDKEVDFKILFGKRRVVHLNKVKATLVRDSEKHIILNMGLFPFEKDGNIIGGFIVLRDITAECELVDKNKSRETESLRDALTGAYNRNFVSLFLAREIPDMLVQAKSGKFPDFSVIMADIDFFKKVNDVYGHVAGDETLKMMVQALRKATRSSDIISRYGGEEFLILLPQTNLDRAVETAKRMNEHIAALEISHEALTFKITASLGVAQWLVGIEDFTQAVERADLALYESKHNGRNQVTFSAQADNSFVVKKTS